MLNQESKSQFSGYSKEELEKLLEEAEETSPEYPLILDAYTKFKAKSYADSIINPTPLPDKPNKITKPSPFAKGIEILGQAGLLILIIVLGIFMTLAFISASVG